MGYQDRRTKKILKNMSDAQKEIKVYQLSYIILGVIQDYWAVLINKVSLENAELHLKETTKVRNITAKNVRLGLMDSFNLNYYNAPVAGAKAQLTIAKQKFNVSLRNLLTTLNQNPNLVVTGTVVFSNKMPELNKSLALKAAYKKRADYKLIKVMLDNARMQLQLQKNNDLPSLTASIGLNSFTQQQRVTDAYSDTYSGRYPTIDARVKMSYPLGDSAQKVRLRNAKYNIKQARIELNKTKRKIYDDVSTSIENIQTAYKLYQRTREARIQSERFYWKMLRSMYRGRLNAATVKNGVDALIQSRTAELQALVNFNLSKLGFYAAKNELFEHYNIDPYKYIPKEK